jgi:hypothetical protein
LADFANGARKKSATMCSGFTPAYKAGQLVRCFVHMRRRGSGGKRVMFATDKGVITFVHSAGNSGSCDKCRFSYMVETKIDGTTRELCIPEDHLVLCADFKIRR